MSLGLFDRFFDEIDAPDGLRQFLLTELASPARRWHGLLHHALMLRRIDKGAHRAIDRRHLILAVFFHDIVYDATRTDNEEASAQVASRWLTGDEADVVTALILATRTHDLATADPVTRMLLDADLAVLWTANAALYRHYATGIRAEYSHVPDETYRTGRTAVLRQLEGQLVPFLAPPDRRHLARNLGGEITALADPDVEQLPGVPGASHR